jgi:hypothetical protein
MTDEPLCGSGGCRVSILVFEHLGLVLGPEAQPTLQLVEE